MLLLGLDIPLWLVLLLVSCLLLYWHGTSTFGTFKKHGIPYRTPLIPCLGNLPQQITKSFAVYDMEQRNLFPRKICGAFEGRQPKLEIADAEFLYQVTHKYFLQFRNHANILTGERFNKSLLFTVDDHWKHQRSILTPTFTSGKLKLMFDVICSRADKLVSHIRKSAGAPIIVKEYTGGFTADVIASIGFGMDIDVQSETNHPFVRHAGTFVGVPRNSGWKAKCKEFVIILTVLVLPVFLRKILKRLFGLSFLDSESCDYIEKVIDNVLANVEKEDTQGKKNFISLVSDKLVDLKDVDKSTIHVSTDDEGTRWTTAGLTKDDVYDNAVIFISAGYETTASALQFLCYNMAMNPEIQEKLYDLISEVDANGDFTYDQLQDLEYLDWCIKESLRILPPAVRLERLCNEDCTISGIHITKGVSVVGLVYAIHHDPDYWPEPETYNPERFSPENKSEIQQRAFLPFGAGNRMCVAYRLALLELKVAAVKLLTNFRFERVAETPALAELEFKKAIVFLQTEHPLKLSAISRHA